MNIEISNQSINIQFTGATFVVGGAGIDTAWGDITGTLSDQTDLQSALNAKQATLVSGTNIKTINSTSLLGAGDIVIGGAVDSVNGQTGVVVLNQDDILDGATYKQYSQTEKTKLAGIQAGAEVNINADWNAVSGDAQILNKPTIPDISTAVLKADYTPAHSILVQQSGTGSPTTLSVGNNTLIGRLSGGGTDINDLSTTQVRTLLNINNVDNTSDLNKPISTATQTALNLKLDSNSPITGATKTKITYDNDGLVTAGADATTADIADSLNRRYVTDTDLTKLANTSGTNTGDQTSIVGITGTTTQFNTALTGDDFVFATRNITTATGLTGGGNLSADRTLSLDIAGLTTETAINPTLDFVPFYDDSAGATRKLAVGNINKTISVRAMMSANQTITTGAGYTPINFNTETFDIGGYYDNTTYNFTPLVAGYYQAVVNTYYSAGTSSELLTGVRKNGAGGGSTLETLDIITSSNVVTHYCGTLIFCNGTTDYLTAYARSVGANRTLDSNFCSVTYRLIHL